MKLSVFDQSPAPAGKTQSEALADSLALAEAVEGLGYHRFWVSEHHSNATLVGSAPEILAAAIAARTSRMRVGTAGVLLPYYAPFKVAEQFRVMDAIAPGRIDLGIGRSPGGQGQEAALTQALQRREGVEHREALRDLLRWVHDEPDAPFGVRATPQGPTTPDVWVLGGSCNGARLAAELGMPFAFNFSNGVLPDGADEPLALYHAAFRPSPRHPRPCLALQISALAAATREEAEEQFLSRGAWRVDLMRGVRAPLASPAQAREHARSWSREERAAAEAMLERHFVGETSEVAARLRALAERYDAAELVIPTWTHDPAVRLNSYRLLAEAMPENLA